MQRVLGGRYELGPAIGSGGFGTVFRATDRRSGAEVAVKFVASGLGSEAAAQRLRREGTILRRVTSRHVARVYDTGEDESGVWLVTELVDGAPLTIGALGRPLLPHEVLRVARGLLEGLAAVHAVHVVHGDVKPSNILVPMNDKALDSAKLVDFGLARIVSRSEVAASIGEAMTREGTVLGTARYMAPEVLSGGEPSTRSDVYSAGLVLFELLDVGALFPASDARGQLRARVSSEPTLGERVPEPLSDVLRRMLCRDPAARYGDATVAHEAVVDLDTAPVSVVSPESIPPSARLSIPPSRTTTVPPIPRSEEVPGVGSRRPTPPPPSTTSTSPPPPSVRPSLVGRALAQANLPRRTPSSPPAGRLTLLPANPTTALRETLRYLDLPMLDALARRERGNAIGRIARALALALRLELDAAALILEPLALQSDIARAMGVCVLAPRARRVTRGRVDSDREDRWVDTIDPELGAMLVAFATALSTSESHREEATREVARCARALARLDALEQPSAQALRTTLRVAEAAARVKRGELDRGVARDLVAPLVAGGPPLAPFHVIVRALAASLLAPLDEESRDSVDDNRTMNELERAERTASEMGITLLDAAAATALGTALSRLSPRDERGLSVLERAGTLLAHSDAPGLESEAKQRQGVVLLALGRWPLALEHLRAARDAARGERANEHELVAASLETLAALAMGDTKVAYEAAAVLSTSRLVNQSGWSATLAWIARALTALSGADPDGAFEALSAAETKVQESSRAAMMVPFVSGGDLAVIVEVLIAVTEVTRGARTDVDRSASLIASFVTERGFEGQHWLDLVSTIIERFGDAGVRERAVGAVRALTPFLRQSSRLPHDRRTDAPPGAALS